MKFFTRFLKLSTLSFFLISQAANSDELALGAATCQAPDSLSNTFSSTLSNTIKVSKSAHDAFDAAKRLKRGSHTFYSQLFLDPSFRKFQTYYNRYVVQDITDELERDRFENSDLLDLAPEIEVLKEDLKHFVEDPSVNYVFNRLLADQRIIFETILLLDNTHKNYLHILISSVIHKEQEADKLEKDIREFFKIQIKNNEELSSDEKKSMLASFYLLAHIFNNNNHAISLLYNNSEVIQEIGRHIESTYGSNAILTFATQVAPFVDTLHRDTKIVTYENVKKYKYPIIIVTVVAGIVYLGYKILYNTNTQPGTA